MPANHASRLVIVLAGLGLLGGCSSGRTPAPSQPLVQEAQNCPLVVQREGTSILRQGEGDALQYIASISQTSRSCRVENGSLIIEVGVAGQVTPGPAARAGQAQLPVRVAVTRGDEVLYSNLGRVAVAVTPGVGSQPFSFVDRAIRLVEPASSQVNIQVGFDERN